MRWPWRRNEDLERIAKAEAAKKQAQKQLAETRELTKQAHELGAEMKVMNDLNGFGVAIEFGMGRRRWKRSK